MPLIYGKSTLAEVIVAHFNALAAELRVSLPGEIRKFDPETQLAEVKPLLRESVRGEDGAEVTESLPVIVDVPVQFPSAGGHSFTVPVRAGDPCLLVFTDRGLDKWIAAGGEVDPITLQRHHLTDAVAILGIHPKATPIPDFDNEHTTLGKDGEAADFVALAAKVDDMLGKINDLVTKLCTHEHAVAGAVASPVTPPLVPAIMSSTASATVKAKG